MSTLALLALLLGAATPTARAGAGWRLPVDGTIVGGFRVTPDAPFAAGQRRGIDLHAPPGATVRAACSGRVTFSGRVPAPAHARRDGATTRAVTVLCAGSLYRATHVGLVRTSARRGSGVVRGGAIGRLGPTGILRLGARSRTDPGRYVDPLDLLESSPGPIAPGPGPVGGRPGARPRRPGARPAPVVAPLAPGASRATVPAVAWVGLALAAAGAPMTLTRRRRRRARAQRRRVAATDAA